MSATSEKPFNLNYRSKNGKIVIAPEDLPGDCIIASKDGTKKLFTGKEAENCWKRKPDIMYRAMGSEWLVYKSYQSSETIELRQGSLTLPHLYIEGRKVTA